MKKVNWLILPQEDLYLKANGAVYNDVKSVACSELKTNLASLHLVPSLLDFSHLCSLIFILLKKRNFLKVEHAPGTEKE